MIFFARQGNFILYFSAYINKPCVEHYLDFSFCLFADLNDIAKIRKYVCVYIIKIYFYQENKPATCGTYFWPE